MEQVESVTWFPPPSPNGGTLRAPITWSPDSDKYNLQALDGTGTIQHSQVSTKGPFQLGETFLSSIVTPRNIVAVLGIGGDDITEHLALRQNLAKSLVIAEHGHHGVSHGNGMMMANGTRLPRPGILHYHRPGLPDVEIEAVPIDSPKFDRGEGPMSTIAEIDLWCPSPLWRATQNSSVTIQEGGGVGYPLEYPLEYTQITIRATIVNKGDHSTSPVFRVFGEIVNPVIINETTGRMLRLETTVESNEMIEIDTGFGRKSIIRHNLETGMRTNAFGSIDLEMSEFWELDIGQNVVTLDWDANVDGILQIIWRELIAGV